MDKRTELQEFILLTQSSSIDRIIHFQVNGIRYVVCKGCLMKTFDVNMKFIKISAKKYSVFLGVITLNQRGKHEYRKKISVNKKDRAIDNILTIHMCESH